MPLHMEMEDLHSPKRSRLHSANRATGVRWACGPPASAVKVGDERHNRSDDVKNREDASQTVRHWHQHASRICRVSRASGGKDRHSKVLTAKGLRDRRVRLSVSTAIQFYDLQDRLGVDQPSKAVEWLIKAASAAINELPALDGPFPKHFDQLIVEEESGTRQKENDAVDEMEDDTDDGERNDEKEPQQQNLSLSKSPCSSTSVTSKGSESSLLRTEYCVKARDCAKGRDCDKKKENGDVDEFCHHLNLHGHDAQSSFTFLLSGSVGNAHDHDSVTLAQSHTADSANVGAGLFSKQFRNFPVASATTDCFVQSGSFGQGEKPQQTSGLPAQSHLGSISSIGMTQFNAAAATATSGDLPEMQQQFSFLQDHLIPVAAVAARGEYSLNFSISSGLAGFNRGTLQSNSQSIMSHNHHLQRLSSAEDGSNLPFFLTAPTPTAPASGVSPFPTGYDSRLQLCYGDEYQNADLKRKEKGRNYERH